MKLIVRLEKDVRWPDSGITAEVVRGLEKLPSYRLQPDTSQISDKTDIAHVHVQDLAGLACALRQVIEIYEPLAALTGNRQVMFAVLWGQFNGHGCNLYT